MHKSSSSFFVRTIFVLLLMILGNSLFAEGEVTTISIVNAQKTTYTKSENGNDCIVLEGSVEISVKKGSTSSEIKADTITYDRKTEMLYANGNVVITTKDSNSGGETTTADSLLMNTATLEGVFDGGRVVQTQSDALNLPSGSTLIVFSDLFGKTEANTISFKNSRLTFCDDPDPHWFIDSSRTWLLPGGEFAFLNALLYVGHTPVLWLPAFYYPKDELIFNPVFVTYKRKGYAIQNTYYLLGRKGLNSGSSSSSSSSSDDSSSTAESLKALYNFMKPTSLKEQERQGLIMHNLDENYTGKTTEYLKLMADYYSNLGYFVGLDGVFQPKNKNITSLKFYTDLGFSKTIFSPGGAYTSIGNSGNTYWDHSNFMGIPVPFRYGANFEMSVAKPFKTTITMPLYSDPYFYYDFLNRNESMDWISYFLSHDSDDSSNSSYSSFSWKISSSYSPTLPAAVKPYISSLSFSLNSSLNFGTATSDFTKSNDERIKSNVEETILYEKTRESAWGNNTPERSFYYPSQIIPATVNVSMSGTLLQYPKTATATTAETNKDTKVDFPVALIMPEELKTEKQKQQELEEAEKNSINDENSDAEILSNTSEENKESKEVEEVKVQEDLLLAKLPELSTSVSSVTVPGGLAYKLGYSVAPNLTTQINYDVNEVKDDKTTKYLYTPSDFEWDKIKSNMYTFKMPTSISSTLGYGGSYFSMTNKLSYDPIVQDHPNKDGITSDSQLSMRLADKKASTQTLSESNSIVYKPFAYVPMFSDTSISWNTNINLWKKEYIGSIITKDGKKGIGFNDRLYEDENEGDLSYGIWDYWIDEDVSLLEYFTDKEVFRQKLISANTVNLTLGAKEANARYKQNLTYSVTLPPQLWKHTLSLNTVFPNVTNTLSWSAQKKKTSAGDESSEENTSPWTLNNISQSMSISLFDNKLKISESSSILVDKEKYNKRKIKDKYREQYNISDAYLDLFNAIDSFKVSASWKKMTASYVMAYTDGYDLGKEQGSGWQMRDVKQFLPSSLSFSWSPNTSTYYRMANKISVTPSLSTSVTADLIRATNSYLLFTPSLTFKINDFLDLSFSASSRNSTLYWYFQTNRSDNPYRDIGFGEPFTMFFGDLFRSFGLGKGEFIENRKASGFKLKSLNMTASHDAHDWSFKMIWKFEPKLISMGNGSYKYNFDPYISFAIVWKPMDSMKTAIVHEYNDTLKETVWELNP